MNGKRSLARRIVIAIAAVAGAIVLLVVVLVLLVDSNVATKRAVDLVLPSVSRALGREVTLKGARLHVFPNASVSLAGFAVAGRPGEPPLAELESLDVDVALWPLLRSLGKQIDVRAFTLVRPSVSLVRGRDGTWNYEGLGGPAPAGAQPAPAPAPEGGGATSVAVRVVRISKAAIRMIDRSTGKDDAGLALKDLDLEATGVGPGMPLDARIAAALAANEQNLTAQLSIAKLPAGVPLRPEDWPEVQGSVKLAALAVDRIRSLLPAELGAIVRGGTVTLDAKLSTGADRAYRVEGTGDLKDLKLRGQPASGRFRAVATWAPARPDAARVDLADLALRGPGVDLGGHASVETAPLRASFVLTGPLLDLDTVMGLLPDQPQPAAPAPAGGDVVPEATRRQIQSATARGTIAIQELRGGRLRATGVTARATLARGTLTLDQMDAAVFGGRVSAAGTSVSLAGREPTWKLAAKLSAVDLAETLKAFAGRSPLLGKLDGTLDVAGSGTDWAKMREGLAGLAALAVKDGTLTTTDLGATVLGGVSTALAAAGRSSAAKRVEGAAGGKTSFRDFAGQFTVKDGFLAAKSPLKFATGAGDVALGGRIGLDGRLDLTGDVAVPKKALAGVASGIPLPEKVVVPLGLGGTLESPRVNVRADEAVSGLARGEARRAAEKLGGKAQEEGKRRIGDFLKRFGK